MRNLTNLKIWWVISICLLAVVVPAWGQPWDGIGTAEFPYLIYDAVDMQAIGADPNYWDSHFQLMSDIDLSCFTGTQFNIIGNLTTNFTGFFNGNDKTILNFTYVSDTAYDVGLFSYVQTGGVIKNLKLINPNVSVEEGNGIGLLVARLVGGVIESCYIEGGNISGNARIGGLVGANFNGGRINNCHVRANIIGKGLIGGLVALNRGEQNVVTNCSVEGEISAVGVKVGGLVGENENGLIKDCYFKGKVSSANEKIGGLVGENENGLIRDCYFKGTVFSTKDNVGGLVGSNSYKSEIRCCFTEADVSGKSRIGGLAGETYGEISNCYASGNVEGDYGVGGLIGYNASIIRKSYSSSSVNFSKTGGGLVGRNETYGYVIASCWDIDSSGQTNSDGGEGKTSDQMLMKSTFTYIGWDFVGEVSNGLNDIWKIIDQSDYPRLWWEQKEHGDLVDLEIIGPDYVFDNSASRYYAMAYYSDSSEEYVTRFSTWSVDSNDFANFYEKGVLDANDVTINETITIHAEYQYGGKTLEADKVVEIVNKIPRILHVDDDANGNDDGSSWENAFRFLQDALAVSYRGDLLLVAQGIYKPSYSQEYPDGTSNIYATFQLKNGVTIKGGYGGLTADDPNHQDVELFETILSGILHSSRSYHVITGSGTDRTALLDGFIITGGNASYPEGLYGGGLYNELGSPSIVRCVIRSNQGHYGGGVGNHLSSNPSFKDCIVENNYSKRYGGGVYNEKSRSEFTNCLFNGNRGSRGAGMYSKDSNPIVINCMFQNNPGGGMGNSHSNPLVKQCIFEENETDGYGGAADNRYSNPTFIECSFNSNTAEMGGGIYNQYGTSLLVNCIFLENRAESSNGNISGGAMYNKKCDPTIIGCTFIGNWAYKGGGAIYNGEASPIVRDCSFINNTAVLGGGIYNYRNSSLIERSVFMNNVASENGGGLYNSSYGNLLIRSCIFSGNKSGDSGGGVFNLNSDGGKKPGLYNCTLVGNRGRGGRGVGFYSSDPDTPTQYEFVNCIFRNGGNEFGNTYGSQIEVSFSNIQGGWTGSGNMDVDPLFVEDGYWDTNGTPGNPRDDFWVDGNYRLRSDSPCIDVGQNLIVEPDSNDLDGNPRILDGDNDGVAVVDMGAYEFFHANIAPVANAGAYQIVYAWIDGMAEVKLDGSGSYDADGDELEYFWFEGPDQIATGIDPNVLLSVGEHIIELIVDDGTESSEPNDVVITVIGPIEANVHIVPRVINRNNRMKRVMAIIRLPEGIRKGDVVGESFELYAGGLDAEPVGAILERVIGWGNMTRVFALFDKEEVMNAVEHNGRVELTVVGRLESGQYIYGSDTVRIIQPRRWPRRRLKLR